MPLPSLPSHSTRILATSPRTHSLLTPSRRLPSAVAGSPVSSLSAMVPTPALTRTLGRMLALLSSPLRPTEDSVFSWNSGFNTLNSKVVSSGGLSGLFPLFNVKKMGCFVQLFCSSIHTFHSMLLPLIPPGPHLHATHHTQLPSSFLTPRKPFPRFPLARSRSLSLFPTPFASLQL